MGRDYGYSYEIYESENADGDSSSEIKEWKD
jgi:hypothetical protein